MANRLGIFLGAIIFVLGLLVAHPWTYDASYIPGGQMERVELSTTVAATFYAVIREMGWVFTGKLHLQ